MFIVNKADGALAIPAARLLDSSRLSWSNAVSTTMHVWMEDSVLLASAHTGKGVEKVWNKILEFRSLLLNSGGLEAKRQ